MNRYTTLLALAMVLALGAGVAQAGKGNKADKPAKAGKVDKKNAIAGTVVKSDASSITLQTRGKKGAEVTVAIDASTKFEGVASAADLKAGQRVIATPNTGTATKIVVHGGKGDKAGKKANKNAAK